MDYELKERIKVLYGCINVFGPYLESYSGRNILTIELPNGNLRKRMYARVLMAVKLGRLLDRNETVDHINELRTDDRIENLQLLSQSANSKKHTLLRYAHNTLTIKCQFCDKEFSDKLSQIPIAIGGTNKKYKHKFCSRKCRSDYYHEHRNNKRKSQRKG